MLIILNTSISHLTHFFVCKTAGARAQYAGDALGTGVTAAAARELGLAPGTAVATSLIDANAGWLGSILCHEGGQTQRAAPDRTSARRVMGARVALICGTSICQMWQAPWRCLVPGVWGPFPEAVISGHFQLAGGLTAVGSLVWSMAILVLTRKPRELYDEFGNNFISNR